MSTIGLLMGLLVLTYVGALVLRGGRGLPTGAEFVGLGIVCGPHALGVVERSSLVAVEPILQVALAWLALVVGVDFGKVGARRTRRSHVVLGAAGAVGTAFAVGVPVSFVLSATGAGGFTPFERVLVSAGLAVTCAETTRVAVRWAAERYAADGPGSALLLGLASADDVVPLLGLGVVLAADASARLPPGVGVAAAFAITLGIGLALGGVSAVLVRHAEGPDLWGVLLGSLLLAVGVASALGLSTLLVAFVLGLVLARTSRSRRALRELLAPLERPILLPVLVMAGARADLTLFVEVRSLLVVVVAALALRVVAKLAFGAVLVATQAPLRRGGGWVGPSLLSGGPMTVSCGLVFSTRFPGPVGDTVLVVALVALVLGELAAPLSLRRLLRRLGETGETPEPLAAEGGAR